MRKVKMQMFDHEMCVESNGVESVGLWLGNK